MLTLRKIAHRLSQPRHIDFIIESGHKDMGELRNFTREVLRPQLPGTYQFHDKRHRQRAGHGAVFQVFQPRHEAQTEELKPQKALWKIIPPD
jgi:hypothetical protein